jgi:hypothetical protein
MPHEIVLGQILNSDISKKLIERNVPGLTSVISDQKNSPDDFGNLYDYYAKHSIM